MSKENTGCMNYDLNIDIKELKQQIKQLLFSDIAEPYKTGLHNLLGEILDQAIDMERELDD